MCSLAIVSPHQEVPQMYPLHITFMLSRYPPPLPRYTLLPLLPSLTRKLIVVTFANEKNLGLVAFDERVWRERQGVGCVQGHRHCRPNDSFPWSQSRLILCVVLVAGASVIPVDIPGDQHTIIRLKSNYSS
jgi:hypothetical protein